MKSETIYININAESILCYYQSICYFIHLYSIVPTVFIPQRSLQRGRPHHVAPILAQTPGQAAFLGCGAPAHTIITFQKISKANVFWKILGLCNVWMSWFNVLRLWDTIGKLRIYQASFALQRLCPFGCPPRARTRSPPATTDSPRVARRVATSFLKTWRHRPPGWSMVSWASCRQGRQYQTDWIWRIFEYIFFSLQVLGEWLYHTWSWKQIVIHFELSRSSGRKDANHQDSNSRGSFALYRSIWRPPGCLWGCHPNLEP